MQSVNDLILAGAAAPIMLPPLEVIPDTLKPFWCFVHELGIPKYTHTSDSKYCRIEEIQAGREWYVRFEDMDEEAAKPPDWDYDEPILHVVRTNDELLVTLQKYGGWGYSDVYYGEKLIFKEAGGIIGRHVGKQEIVGTGVEPPPDGPPPPPVGFAKYLPYMLGAGLFVGMVAVAAKKK